MLSSCIVGNEVVFLSAFNSFNLTPTSVKTSKVFLIHITLLMSKYSAKKTLNVRRFSDSGENESMNIYVDVEGVTCIQVSYVHGGKKSLKIKSV